jgi:polyhydroxybutyrate depolymerase
MASLVTNTRWAVISLIFVLLVSCTPEKPTAIPSLPNSESTPEITSQLTIETTSTITPSPAPERNCTRGDYVEKIESNGQVREYRLHIPSTYSSEKATALVLGFHGANSTAESFESYSRFSRVADREGFIVVYPQALGAYPTWNTASGQGNPDIQFVSDLIDTLQSRCNIDRTRIYASGASNGGGMANRLACNLADRIAAIGPVSGAYQGSEECAPSRPVAIFAIHGTDDPVIPYNGVPNSGEPPMAYNIISIPIPQWAFSWAKRNECDPQPEEIVHNVVISEKKWSNCHTGADVDLYTIQGGGHAWPSDLIDVAQTIWGFFVQHPQK